MPASLGGGGGRSFGLRLSSSSSQSSTLTELSTYSSRISTKGRRTPRKRPNQRYHEAAALLSTANPKLFSPDNVTKLCIHTMPFSSFSNYPDFLPTIADTTFLTNQPEKYSFRIDPKQVKSSSISLGEPGSPGFLDDGFDAESILDGEIEEGIDSIMGSLNLTNHEETMNSNTQHLMGLTLSGEDGLRALRRTGEGEQWSSPRVAMRDIIPKFKAISTIISSDKKKSKKKREIEEEANEFSTTSKSMEKLSSNLLLKLNYEEVVKEWSGRGTIFSDDGGAPESSADILSRLVEIVPSLETAGSGGGTREASVMRYKEKRSSRLYSKEIRYQIRKVNADRRPRIKGRFAKRPSLV